MSEVERHNLVLETLDVFLLTLPVGLLGFAVLRSSTLDVVR
jgi:hypothetical protein